MDRPCTVACRAQLGDLSQNWYRGLLTPASSLELGSKISQKALRWIPRKVCVPFGIPSYVVPFGIKPDAHVSTGLRSLSQSTPHASAAVSYCPKHLSDEDSFSAQYILASANGCTTIPPGLCKLVRHCKQNLEPIVILFDSSLILMCLSDE